MGILFDAISYEEQKAIDKYIDYNIETGSNHTDIQYLLREWERVKEPLYRTFGNNLIISKEIEVARSQKELEIDMQAMLNKHEFCTFETKLIDAIERYYKENNNIDTLKHIGINFLWQIFCARYLVSNIWEDEKFDIINPKDTARPIKISNGMKVTKIISKLCEAYDIKGFEEFRIAHSQVLNQKKLKGTLNLSIHPLDYMTMSDNECGWESCMSWRQGGCYRQGTVEMMNSHYVVVAYLTSETPMKLYYYDRDNNQHTLNWSNKKWRELIIVSEEVITTVKSYPYRNVDLSTAAVNWLKDLMGTENYGSTIEYDAFTSFEYDADTDYRHDIEFVPETVNMYNDFSNGAIPIGTFCKRPDSNYHYISLTYSGASECMSCGSLDTYFESEGCLCCEDCYAPYYCVECGDAIPDGEQYKVDGGYFCQCCYEDRVREDVFGNEHAEWNLVKVYLASKATNKISNEYIEVYTGDMNRNDRHNLSKAVSEVHFIANNNMSSYYRRVNNEKLTKLWPYTDRYFIYIEDIKNFNKLYNFNYSDIDEILDEVEFDGYIPTIEDGVVSPKKENFWPYNDYVSPYNEETKDLNKSDIIYHAVCRYAS